MPNPYFNSYQPSYPQYQQPFMQQPQQSFAQQPQPQMMPAQSNKGINWVQGDIGARAFYVAPGMSDLLMDSEGQNFYIKSADMSGMPMLKKYAYTEVVDEPLKLESHDNANEIDTAFHATREEVKQLHEEMKELKDKLAQMEAENKSLREQSNNRQSNRQSQNGGRNNG